jgi:CheY-like chemotaxis protein
MAYICDGQCQFVSRKGYIYKRRGSSAAFSRSLSVFRLKSLRRKILPGYILDKRTISGQVLGDKSVLASKQSTWGLCAYVEHGIQGNKFKPPGSEEGSQMPVRILIADDSKMIRRNLRVFLETNPNWQVCDEAMDGREAVQKSKQLIPDLIILDLAMPVMNGLHAAREISRLLPSVPIVLYSMYATPQVELEAKKVGIRAVVPKTEAPRLLLPTIETVLAASAY